MPQTPPQLPWHILLRSPNWGRGRAAPFPFGPAVAETCQALLFFAGQMLITNFDIVLVKHLFSARMAGLYAAVALVGRVIFSLSSAVVNTMFPLVAGTSEKERKDLRVIATSLLLVVGTGSVLAIGLSRYPHGCGRNALAPASRMTGAGNLSDLAALYAIKSVVYSISVVFIAFEMSHKIANSSVVQLAFTVVLMAGVYEFHSSLLQVILVQTGALVGSGRAHRVLVSQRSSVRLDRIQRSCASYVRFALSGECRRMRSSESF